MAKKKKSKAACFAEYLALRFTCGLINIIPYPLACSIGKAVGAFAFNVLGINKKRTLTRIKSVFPEKTDKEVNAIAVTIR